MHPFAAHFRIVVLSVIIFQSKKILRTHQLERTFATLIAKIKIEKTALKNTTLNFVYNMLYAVVVEGSCCEKSIFKTNKTIFKVPI